jgi:hypothetical protein
VRVRHYPRCSFYKIPVGRSTFSPLEPLIEGAKACGKTETARQIAASEVLLDIDASAREAASVDPALVLEGETPRLIDEWQLEPTIWDHVSTYR